MNDVVAGDKELSGTEPLGTVLSNTSDQTVSDIWTSPSDRLFARLKRVWNSFELGPDRILYGPWSRDAHTFKTDYLYYFYWWNLLPKEYRYFGRKDMYYDGPHCSFGLWFTNISWRSPWTSWDVK